MRALQEKLQKTLRYAAGICLLWGLWLTQAFAVIAVEPAVVAPDENGVVRFSVTVSGVPEPGFRSYALSMQFGGAAVNLVDSINSFTTPPPDDAVNCAARLRLDAVSETVVPGLGVILESGQGAFVLNSVGGGTLLATDNRIVGATTAQYNVGVAGETGVVTPQIGAGSLIDFLCYVGAAVPNGTTVTVTPGLYPGLDGAIFLDQPASLPIDDTFIAGTIQVGTASDQPLLDPIGDKTVNEGELLSFPVTASDPNGDPLLLSATGLPVGATFVDNGDGTASFDWTPGFDQAGTNAMTFTVTEATAAALTDSETISITVTDINRAPTLNPIGNQSVDEGALLSFVVSASDPDSDALSFSATGLPPGATLTDNGDGTASFAWTPGFDQAGVYTLSFSVTDDGVPAQSASESIDITVDDVNQPPVLDPIGNQLIDEGALLSVLISAINPEGGLLSFTASNLPTGATFVDNGDGTALFEWIPDFGQAGNYQTLFTVFDDGTPVASDWEEITITVGEVNRPPELAPIANQAVDEDELLSFLVSATDPDGDGISLSAANLPTGAIFTDNGDGTASFAWTPDFGQAGNYDVSFTATDDGVPVESDSQTVTITVGDVNQPPILNPIGDKSVDEGALLSFAITASDPDGDGLSFSATGLPTGATFADNGDGTASFAWTPDFGEAGNYAVTFTVTDDGVPIETASELITITVGDVNRAPTLDPIGDQTVNEGELLSLVLTSGDPDGDGLSYSVTDLPLGATFVDNGDGTASFAWTPDFGVAGNYAVTFTVTDDGVPALEASETITITAGDVNRPPTLDPIGDQTVNEGEPLSFAITASDPDGDGLSYSALNVPATATFVDNGDGTAAFSWTPEFGEAGAYDVTFVVTDDGVPVLEDSELITITVGDVNRAPTLDPIGDQTVNEGELLSLVLTASDPDGDGLSYSAAGLPTGATFTDNGDGTASFAWTPDFGVAGNYAVTFTVTDDGVPALEASETITITVGDVNRPPTLDPIGDQTVNEGEPLSFVITASDPDGDGLSYSALNVPATATFVDNGDGTAAFSWTPEFGEAGAYDVTFVVTDDGVPVLEDSELITITVGDINRPPVLAATGDKTVNEGELLSFLVTAGDPDGDGLSYSATGLPSGATFTDNGDDTATFSWTPGFDQAGSYPVTFTVTDAGIPILTDSEILTITVIDVVLQQPPVANDDTASTLEDTAVAIDVLANDTDPNGDTLTIVGLVQPANGTVVNNITSLFYTPNPNFSGVDPFSYTIDDGNGGTGQATVTVTVDPVNDPPVLSPIGDQTVDEGVLLSLTLSASDVEAGVLSFSATGLPPGATLTDNGDGTASFAWTPGFDQAGVYTLSFSVTDDGVPAQSASESIDITVDDVNQPPVLDPIGNQLIDEGALLSVLISASDPEGGLLSFTASNLPTGATFVDNGDGTALFEWIPDFGQAGNYQTLFTVFDDGTPVASDWEEITITVGEVNRPPELAPIANQAVDEDELLSFLVSATDPDGDGISLSAANLPTGAIFTDNGDGTASFAWTPDFGQAGNYDVSFTATDDGVPVESDSQTVTITVGDVNQPPVLNPIGDKSVDEGALLSFAITASDPDGDGLSFSATGLPTGATFADNGDGTASFAWTPDFGEAGNYAVTFTVTDDGVPIETASELITITVGDVNRAPTLDPIGNRGVNEGELLEIVLTASDPDGDALSFSATNLPTGALFTDNIDGTALFSWIPDFGQAGNYDVSFTVTDDRLPAESDAETITITVGDINRPPVLDPIGNQIVNEGELLEFVLTAGDPNGDSLNYGATGLPVGSLFTDNGDGTANFAWTPNIGEVGTYEVTFTVSDDGVPVESDFEAITIKVEITAAQFISVDLDIKPTSCPNPLNVKTKGVLPVAILGGEDFDVTQIDPSTVTLEDVCPPLRWAIDDVATPFDGEFGDPPDELACTEEGWDGYSDLTLKFDTQCVVEALGEVEDREVLVLKVTGETRDGTSIEGQDVVRILNKR